MDFDNILYVEYLVHNNDKMKLFYYSNADWLQGTTLMYTLFVFMYDLLNIGLKLLAVMTATALGYALLPLLYMNTSKTN